MSHLGNVSTHEKVSTNDKIPAHGKKSLHGKGSLYSNISNYCQVKLYFKVCIYCKLFCSNISDSDRMINIRGVMGGDRPKGGGRGDFLEIIPIFGRRKLKNFRNI